MAKENPDADAVRARGPRFIIVGKAGQLGNRLLYSAHIMSLAQATGGSVVNLGLAEYAGLFEATARDLWCSWPRPGHWCCALPRWWREWVFRVGNRWEWVINKLGGRALGFRTMRMGMNGGEQFSLGSTEFLEELRSGGEVRLVTGWQELHHLRLEGSEAIRQYFAPVEEHRQAVAGAVTKAREGVEVLVGVHVRQGDYATFLEGRYAYPSSHYWESMRRIAALFPGRRVGFLVCSNEAQTVPAGFAHPVAFGPGVPVQDMYALAECDFLCGPPSTFSLWASFYGRKPVWQIRSREEVPTLGKFEVFQ